MRSNYSREERKYDKMASAKNQQYFFIFVHEDGAGLKKISEIFKDTQIEASVDEVFSLDDVNKALKKGGFRWVKGKDNFEDIVTDGRGGRRYIGASIKDAGKKYFGISLLEDPGMVADLLNRLRTV